jgi:uncharacterized LabA/DUF88 family protein
MNKSVKHTEQRVGIFIDVSNMYMSAQSLYKTNVDFRQVMKTAVAGRRLVRAFAYVIETEEGKEKDFITALEDLGYEVRTKPLQIFKGGAKKGDWDVGLAIDVVRLMPMLDTAVIVSGDGDYVDLLEYLRGHGRRTEVMAFGKTASHRLLDEADEFIDMSQDKKRYLIGR